MRDSHRLLLVRSNEEEMQELNEGAEAKPVRRCGGGRAYPHPVCWNGTRSVQGPHGQAVTATSVRFGRRVKRRAAERLRRASSAREEDGIQGQSIYGYLRSKLCGGNTPMDLAFPRNDVYEQTRVGPHQVWALCTPPSSSGGLLHLAQSFKIS